MMILLKNRNKLLFVVMALFILTSSCDNDNLLDSTTSDVESKANMEKIELNSINNLNVANGLSYMGSNTMIEWEYTGQEAESVDWWYRKVGGQASYLLGRGYTMAFAAIPDTYYSNDSHRTSDFIIYLKVVKKDGSVVRSMDYDIMKKGQYKLVSSL